MDYRAIGSNLRCARKKRGLTLEVLAEQANIGANFLGKIERGTSIPSLETLVKLANALEISMDMLLSSQLTAYVCPIPQQLQTLVNAMPAPHRAAFWELIRVIALHYFSK